MKKLILLLILIYISMSGNAQSRYKKPKHSDKPGTGIIVAGCISMGIGFLLPDGSEWTFKDRYNSQIITKPFYQNPSRDICIGIGLTLTIGGIWYNKNAR
jgi:hypothetical protein